ncbi:MAG: hypothetical protein ACR2PX_00115, partial [Endozoicomonas sp.]|uniref:hypothetical protein n=1 Tax=Endozoicomonas sp. TaxID=1892382 RepID=UPI003D9B1BA3
LWLAAACSRTQCSRGIPEDHPAYQTFLTLEQTGQVCIREVEALERAGFEAYSTRDRTEDWLSQYDTGVQRWIGLTRMLSGAGIVAGSWLTGTGVCTATAGVGCGAGLALAATGSTLGLAEAQQGAEEWNYPNREDPAQRVADSFDPDTHPGERSLLLERSRSLAWVAGENLAAGVLVKLGFKLAKAVEVQRPVDKGMMQGERIVPNSSPLKQTGGGGYTASADELYDAIRASDSDVSAIASSTGFKSENIQKVKDHVFYNEHLLDRYVDQGIPATLGRFGSTIEQAQAWKRLERGTHTNADITWLKHETAEKWYEQKHKSGYSEAHDRVDWRWSGFPWEAE